MKKRLFSFGLVIVLLCSMLPQFSVPVRAVEHILDAAQIDGNTYSAVYGEKLNQIFQGEAALFTNSDVRYPLGSSMKTGTSYTVANTISGYQCYIYAQAVYYYLFGDVIYHGDGYKYWSNSAKVLHNEKTVSYELFSDAKVGFGAYIRTTTSSSGAYNGEKGHSMIVLAYDAQGITFLEGNADGKGLVRITTQTWEEYNDIMLTSKGRRIAHVVQCQSAVCPHADCTELGICQLCGESFDFESTFTADCPGYYTAATPEGVFLKTDVPYEAAPNGTVQIPGDAQVEVLGRVTNAFGETWYKLSWEGQTGYVNGEHFTFVGYGEQMIDCTLTSPAEDAVVPKASYPVIGTVTSKYPLQEVVGELDGESFASVLLGNTTRLDIRSSAINQKLSFSKLSSGYHTLVIKARDIYHDEWITVCTRRFITEGIPAESQTPGKPVLRYTLNDGLAVFTWDATPHTTHYALQIQNKNANGEWVLYAHIEEAVSGLTRQLPAGEYSAELRIYSPDETYVSSDLVYLTVSPNHSYTLQTSTPATCTQAGREEYVCTVCGDSYFKTIPVTDHQYEDHRCTVCNESEDPVYQLHAEPDAKTGKPVLSWNKVTGAKKYEIYRATSENGKYTRLTTTTKTTYTDSKATAGKQYFYKVRVTSSKSCAYNGQYSMAADCHTACARPTVTVKTDAATGKPSLSWKSVTKATGYRVLRRLPGEEAFTVIAELTKKTYLDIQAPVDAVCEYQVQAVGASDALDSALTATLSVTSACARPTLKTDITDDGKPVISWTPVEGATAYRVYRSTKSSKSYKAVETVKDCSYTDATVAAGKSYYYKVVAVGQQSESAYSSYVKATGKCAIPELTVGENTAGKPVLSWNKVTGAKKYEIYRSVDGGSFKKLTTTTKITYTDSKATGGTVCTYKVRALGSKSSYNSAFGLEQSSNVRCAAPAVTAKVDTASGRPNLSWSKVTGAASYEIYRSTDGSQYALVATQSGTSYKDADVQPGTAYSYKVMAAGKKEAFNSNQSAAKAVTATCAQPKPKGSIGTDGKPALSWAAVEEADGYVIYRSTSKSSGYKQLGETEDLTFKDTTAKKNKTYYYKVVALSGDTQSARSGYVKLKAKK